MPFQADLSTDKLSVTEGSGGTAIAQIDSASRDSFILGRLSLGPPQTAFDNTLEVKGALAVGAGYAGTGGVTPPNSLAVEGSLGIGTKTPAAKLDVDGNAFLGYETSVADFGAALKSGFYQNSGAKLAYDVPDAASAWTHVITARHSNTTNNHQLQIAASYATNDKLYFRKIAGTGPLNPVWNELATRGQNAFVGNQSVQGALNVTGSLHVAGPSPALRIADGAQGDGKVLVSDASGNAVWKDNSRYFAIPLSTTAITATTTFQKIANFLTFTKANAASAVEVHLNTRVDPGTPADILFPGRVTFELRIDDMPSGLANTATVPNTASDEFISLFGVFQTLAAGSHTVSVWARTNVGKSVSVNLNPDGGGRVIVKETF